MTAFTVDPRQKKIVDIYGRPIGLPINDFGSRTEIEFTGFTYSSSLSIALYFIRPDYRDGQTMPVYYGTTWTEANGAYKHEMKYGKDYYDSVTQNDSLARLVLVADSVVVLDQEVQIDMIFSYSEDAERLPEAGSGANYATEEYVTNSITAHNESADAHSALFAAKADKEQLDAVDEVLQDLINERLRKTPFYLEAAEANDVVKFMNIGAPGPINLKYSTNGKTWSDYTVGNEITLANVGDRVYFKGNNDEFSSGIVKYYKLSSSMNTVAGGNIMSLVDETLTQATVKNWMFESLFNNNVKLINASNLILPATSLTFGCYQKMFFNCTSLVAGPKELPATALTNSVYDEMFSGCTSLSSAPIIKATSSNGAKAMKRMFMNNTLLNSITVDLTGWVSMSDWVSGISPTGTFYCPAALGTNETIARGTSSCPEGWTVVNI